MKRIKTLIEFIYENYQKTIEVNNSKYNNYIKYKDRAQKVAWEQEDSQIINFELASEFINTGDSVLDYGCGIGDFLKYLKDNEIEISRYMGVDINPEYIKDANKSYPKVPNVNFKLITDPTQIGGNWDITVAIGVFTWFITRESFKETILHLLKITNKRVILTLLNDVEDDCEDCDGTGYYDCYDCEDGMVYIDDELVDCEDCDGNGKRDCQNCEGSMVSKDNERFWKSTYRYYNADLFKSIFPELNMKFSYHDSYIIIEIIK